MTIAIGCSISAPGSSPAMTSGTSARPVASAVMRIGDSRSRAPRRTSAGPNSSPSNRSRCWKWLIIMIPLRAAMPEHGEEADERPERQDAAAEVGRDHAADQRRRQRQERDQRQPGIAERRLQQQEHADGRRDREQQQVVLRRLALGELAEQLGVVALREVDRPERRPRRRGPPRRGRARRRSRRRDQPREVLVLDAVRRRHDRHARERSSAAPAP